MNMHIPFFPYPPPTSTINLEDEIIKLKKEIEQLKIKINNLENKNKIDYMKKDDTFYMM